MTQFIASFSQRAVFMSCVQEESGIALNQVDSQLGDVLHKMSPITVRPVAEWFIIPGCEICAASVVVAANIRVDPYIS